MPLTRFDHVNVRTANLDRMVDWYGRILGLTPGKRPDFNFPGAWLYLGDQALIHLVSSSLNPRAGGNATLTGPPRQPAPPQASAQRPPA